MAFVPKDEPKMKSEGEICRAQRNERLCRLATRWANLLLDWRPGMSSEDVASAVMSALEKYSIEIEGPGESGMRGILVHLKEKCDQRWQGI